MRPIPRIKNTSELQALFEKKMYLFDFDGTLADTERLHWIAYNLCLEKYDVILDESDIKRYIGKQETQIYEMIKLDHNISFNNKSFFNKRINHYLRLVESENLQPFGYFLELLKKNSCTEFNILTSNRLSVINAVLKIWGLENAFSKIISAATNKIDKADVINNVNDHYGYMAHEVALFEDSNTYLNLAKENKILAIGIETCYNADNLTNCDYILSTFPQGEKAIAQHPPNTHTNTKTS